MDVIKKIHIELAENDPVPDYLIDPSSNLPVCIKEIEFGLNELCEGIHRLDLPDFSYDRTLFFSYMNRLSPSPQFHFQKGGLGSTKSKRIHTSDELGIGFCLFVLRRYWDMTFYKSIPSNLELGKPQKIESFNIERISKGDLPDFFCMDSSGKIMIAEAKGRSTTINFGTKDFENWKKQYGRIIVTDPNNTELIFKGFVVATSLGELPKKSHSKVLIEDPKTRGMIDINDSEFKEELQIYIIQWHYRRMLKLAGLNYLSSLITPKGASKVTVFNKDDVTTFDLNGEEYIYDRRWAHYFDGLSLEGFPKKRFVFLLQQKIFDIINQYHDSPKQMTIELLKFCSHSNQKSRDGIMAMDVQYLTK